MGDILVNLCFASIPLWIPGVIGYYLVTNGRNDLSLMAGLVTLKPIITTALWAEIYYSLEHSAVSGGRVALYSILPGALLTVLIFVIFRRLFFGPMSGLAWRLILLDCARWINSFLLTATASPPYNKTIGIPSILALIGLIFPTVYSFVALTTSVEANEE